MQPIFLFSIIVQALLLGTSTVSAKALTNPLESSSGPDQHTFKNVRTIAFCNVTFEHDVIRLLLI